MNRSLRISFMVSGGLLVLLAVCSATSAQQDRSIGFVLELVGSWTADGTSLRIGDAVSPGAEIKAVRGSGRQASSSIGLVLLDGKVVRLSCGNEKPCEPHRLPTSLVRSSSLLERVSAAASNLFGKQPGRYIPTITRGGGETARACLEAVVKLDDGKLSVAPMMKGFRDGQYALSFQPGGQAGAPTAGIPVAFVWQSNLEESAVPVDKLSPGLYSVTVRELGDLEGSCIAQNLWALIVTRAEYDQAAGEFKQVCDGVNSWQGISEAGKRSFLRLSLEFLSTQYQ